MYRRFNGTIAALISLPLLTTGCVQATRHSNMMVFGTNTSLGLKVGTDVAEVPGILVGFNRQEAVILPLVANTASTSATGTGGQTLNRLDPCDVKADVKVVTTGTPPQTLGKLEPHPCLLVAMDKDGKARDSYSVLASFGANFGASQGGTGVNAQGGLAQYFATGMAAQLLALNGGASVVAVGAAAAKSAEAGKVGLNGENVPPTAAYTHGVKLADDYAEFQKNLIGFIKNAKIAEADVAAQITLFEQDSGAAEGVATQCSTKDACTKFIADNESYSARYDTRKDKLSNALKARLAANGL